MLLTPVKLSLTPVPVAVLVPVLPNEITSGVVVMLL